MPFKIIRNDITRVAADAIVNTANPGVAAGRGSDSALFHAAGYERMMEARRNIGTIAPGEAAVTDAFDLNARYVIHTVAPVFRDGTYGEADLLASCYRKSLYLAEMLGCVSIAFPLIASGSNRFPKDKALDIALAEIKRFLDHNEMEVTLVVFDRTAYELSSSLEQNVRSYIDEKYVERRRREEYSRENEYGLFQPNDISSFEDLITEAEKVFHVPESPVMPSMLPEPDVTRPRKAGRLGRADANASAGSAGGLENYLGRKGDDFQTCLFRLIDRHGLTDAEVYKKANLDRKLFSKIRCNPGYLPKKKTAVALAMALELNMDDAVDLLGRAGIALTDSNVFDLIIMYCIEHGIYDLFKVNAILFDYDQPLLGV